MAIFSYDNINAKKNDYNDDVIDSMYEMCQDMLDVLDEHGGARNRYVKMKEDEIRKHRNVSDAYRNAAANSSESVAKRMIDKANEHSRKAGEIADKINGYASNYFVNNDIGQSDYIHRVGSGGREDARRSGSSDGKQRFLARVNKNDKDYGAKPREPGTYKKIQDAKKAAVKETCYMILDMLDDMD